MSLNLWLGIGRLTRDPEVRFTTKGTAVCGFCVACNYTWRDDHGDKQEEVHFQECVTFGKPAEFLGQYAKKGDQVFVEGRLKTEEWDDKKTGQKRRTTKLQASQVQLLGKSQGQRQESADQKPTQSPPRRQTSTGYEPDPSEAQPEDDCPF